ncbi:hypothetical protein H257_06143 [Aphanomyces astaci]|uniref:Uncharacterized protein n=1 Tax=Aphanomyces astaci TaxID=112090 RepID=W4GNQ3_APHAT|nr:hypothetical protein H257_06143 [Aphanomyces astaci]ETV80619.1 hypothetical protein H257_06143 [Aphanomyces astaci]|eukprot:XP_009829566.1 hypothetical protein H257_06143 [Aphanomyces astaci]
MRDRPERIDPVNPRPSKETSYLGGAMMTPERKRDAESSPNVSPPTDRHDSRPPLKKLALAEENELAVTCPPLSVKSGLEEWDSDNATSARLLNPVMAPGYSSLVQEESVGQDLLQERLASEWESQKALILREKDSQVAMLTRQSTEKLRSIRAEAAHAMEVRHMEEAIHHESALNQLREDHRSAKRAHVEDVQLLAGESRKDIATLESTYEARDE